MTVYRYTIRTESRAYVDIAAASQNEADKKVEKQMDSALDVMNWEVIDLEELETKVEDGIRQA